MQRWRRRGSNSSVIPVRCLSLMSRHPCDASRMQGAPTSQPRADAGILQTAGPCFSPLAAPDVPHFPIRVRDFDEDQRQWAVDLAAQSHRGSSLLRQRLMSRRLGNTTEEENPVPASASTADGQRPHITSPSGARASGHTHPSGTEEHGLVSLARARKSNFCWPSRHPRLSRETAQSHPAPSKPFCRLDSMSK